MDLAPQTLLRKNMKLKAFYRAPKRDTLEILIFFVKLLHGGVGGAKFLKQAQTCPKLDGATLIL